MKQFLVSLLLLTLTIAVSAQNHEVIGKWKGEWSNDRGHYFKFVLDLQEDQFGELSGEFVWKLVKSARTYEQNKLGLTAIEYVSGSYKNKKLRLKGLRKDDPHLIIGIDNYELTLSENREILDGITENHGTWKGVFYGSRQIEKKDQLADKQELKGREIVTTQEFRVVGNEIRLQFWDDNKEDGDIISLNLNGEWILKNYVVKKMPGEVILDLIEGDNYLILHAENLGEVAPNTAAISISDDTKKRATITLNSDMGKSEAIKIIKN